MALYDEMMGRCEKNVATLENRSAEPRVAFCHVDNTRISHGLHAMELCSSLTESLVDYMIEDCLLTVQSN